MSESRETWLGRHMEHVRRRLRNYLRAVNRTAGPPLEREAWPDQVTLATTSFRSRASLLRSWGYSRREARIGARGRRSTWNRRRRRHGMRAR